MDLFAVISGFAVGAIVGMTGVGGGSLMTPLLIGAFKLNPATAIGTDLWFAAVTKSGGAWAHHRQGHVDWSLVRLLLLGSLPAAVLTLALMYFTGLGKTWFGVLSFSLGIALLLTAVTVAYRSVWATLGKRLEAWLPPARRNTATVCAGALLGVLVTLSSIGAGAVGATLILLLYPRHPTQQVVGSDIAHAVPLTLVAGNRFLRGTLTHALLEHLPQIPEPARHAAASAFVAKRGGGLSQSICASIVTETLAILAHPTFKPLFGVTSRAEVPLSALLARPSGKGPTLRLSGKIDRITVGDKEILIVDYKTNRPPPLKPETVAPAYLYQLAAYVLALQEIYPGHAVRATLLWTDGPRLMEIPAPMMQEYMARLWDLDQASLDAD